MKYYITTTFIALLSITLFAQNEPIKDFPYQFKEVHKVFSSEIKDQCKTGTCWSFATTSFIESEIFRMGHGQHDISEMYNVRMTYPEKAKMYLRYQGKNNFSAGSLAHDVIKSIEKHGVVTEESYPGRENPEEDFNHGELDKVLKAMMDAIIANGHASEHWEEAIDGVLDAYLGEVPENFDTKGGAYTPMSFKEKLEIKTDEYVNVSSFTHHPFYEEFVLEVPDNFSQGKFQNAPISELTEIVKSGLKQGFTVAWDADVSEAGFSFKNGMAILPKDKKLRRGELFKEKVEEATVTQETRQEGFDNFDTTDDHLMQIIGLSKDQDGTEYFVIKNSWGSDNQFGGKQYVSIPYFEAKTISILVHQDAVPSDILKKMKG